MKNKYLFLDFDGVLNSNKNYRTLQMLGVPTRDEYGTIFDSKCVECLRDIIDTIEIKIVITSSWRFIYDMNMLCGMWRVRELPGYFLIQQKSTSKEKKLITGLKEQDATARRANTQFWMTNNHFFLTSNHI